MTGKNKTETGPATPVVDRQVVAELVAAAQADGMPLSGEGGLLAQLTKLVFESSLEGEMDAHLGYGKHDAAGRDGGNSRNGTRSKTVLTEAGPVEIVVPRCGRRAESDESARSLLEESSIMAHCALLAWETAVAINARPMPVLRCG